MSDDPKTTAESGQPRLILDVQTSSLAGRRFGYSSEDLRKGVMIGRAPDCKLRFDGSRDLKVSGHHALLEERDDGIFVRDQGSSNGLYVNKERVTAAGTRLYDGSELSLGQEGAVMTVRIPGEAPPPASSLPDTVAAGGRETTVADEAGARTLTRMVGEVGDSVGAGDKTKRMIKEVAARLESRAARRRANLVTLVGALFMALAAAGAIGVWYYMNAEAIEAQDRTAMLEREEQREQAERERQRREAEREAELREMREKIEGIEADLAEQVSALREEQDRRFNDLRDELDESTVERIRAISEEQFKELKDATDEQLRKLEGLGSGDEDFARLAEAYNESVFLIFVQYPLLNADGKPVGIESGTGTGWLARTAANRAWVVTNKHVIKPFLFKPELAISHAIRDVRPAPFKDWVIAAWRPGNKLREHVGASKISVSEAWANLPGGTGGRGSLAVKGFAPDDVKKFGDDYESHLTRAGFRTNLPADILARVKAAGVHDMNTFNDLAVLEFERKSADELAMPLPMASDEELAGLRQMQRVMSLGYPLGLSVIKGTRVTTSPATGDIRSLQFEVGVIGTSAPILPGNSGGPLINSDGKVIGVITRRFEGTQGEAISIDKARNLIKTLTD